MIYPLFILLILVATGCAHKSEPAELPHCPAEQYVGLELEAEDIPHLKHARQVCYERYSNSPCVVKFNKTQRLSYQVTCGAYETAPRLGRLGGDR